MSRNEINLVHIFPMEKLHRDYVFLGFSTLHEITLKS